MRGATRRSGAMGLLLAGLLLAAPAGCTGTDVTTTPSSVVPATPAPTSPAPTSGGPVRVFSVDDDTLCDWVTPRDVATFVEQVNGLPTGTVEVVLVGPGLYDGAGPYADAARLECTWRLASDSPDDEVWIFAGTGSGGLPAAGDVVEYASLDDPDTRSGIGTPVSGHPSLSEGVVARSNGFGTTTFFVPPADHWLTTMGPSEYESRSFAFADLVLRDLGWAP